MVFLTLLGSPLSTNNIYRSVCRGRFPTVYMSPQGKALKESYQWQAKMLHKGKPLEGDLEISIVIFQKTKRKTDWDNFNKIVMDSLSGIVWVDDSQIQVAHVEKAYDKENPRIELTIKNI